MTIFTDEGKPVLKDIAIIAATVLAIAAATLITAGLIFPEGVSDKTMVRILMVGIAAVFLESQFLFIDLRRYRRMH